jgi:hypothetical protein
MHQDYRASRPSRSANKCRPLLSNNRHSGNERQRCPAGNYIRIRKKPPEAPGENHPLEALDAGVLDYRKGEGVGVNGQQDIYCCHLRGSSALSNVPAPFDISKRLFDREGGFTRKAWIG